MKTCKLCGRPAPEEYLDLEDLANRIKTGQSTSLIRIACVMCQQSIMKWFDEHKSFTT